MIQIKQLEKSIGAKFRLSIEGLQIDKSEVVAFLGNNGSGKTTLLRLVLDLVEADSGCVMIKGLCTNTSSGWKVFASAYLGQSFLIQFLTPEEYFIFLKKINTIDESEYSKRINQFKLFFNNEVLDKKKYISNLSTGNMAKVGICGAFLKQSELIVLDEPFANLDPYSQKKLCEIVRNENEKGLTFLISSHHIDLVKEICTRFIVLKEGKIIYDLQNNDLNVGLIKEIMLKDY
jgi:ABC-2 type transport system ATP-binding protein